MVLLKLSKVSATEVAQLFGISRGAVYAARYRYRHGYSSRPIQEPLSIHVVTCESSSTPTSD